MSFDLGFVRVDLDRRVVHRQDGAPDRLTTTEASLLRHLWARRGEVVGRDELFTQVWGYAPTALSRACDNAIWRLRQKLEVDPAEPSALDGPGEAEARAALARHLDNLLHAVETGLQAGDAENTLWAAAASWQVLAAVGPARLALAWVPALAALPLTGTPAARARLLAGEIRAAAGNLGEAREDFTAAARLAARRGDAALGAEAHLALAALAHALDVEDRSAADADVALALARTLGDEALISRALCAAGRSRLARYQSAEARGFLGAALTAAVAAGARRREAEARHFLGAALDRDGRAEALEALRRAAAIARDLGDRRLEAEVLRDMGALGAAQWHPWGAAALAESQRLFEAVGYRPGLADALILEAIQLLNAERLEASRRRPSTAPLPSPAGSAPPCSTRSSPSAARSCSASAATSTPRTPSARAHRARRQPPVHPARARAARLEPLLPRCPPRGGRGVGGRARARRRRRRPVHPGEPRRVGGPRRGEAGARRRGGHRAGRGGPHSPRRPRRGRPHGHARHRDHAGVGGGERGDRPRQ